MSRLPQPGQDAGSWGDILNDYLSTSLAADGSLRPNTVGTAQLKTGAVMGTVLADGVVDETKLSSTVQTTLSNLASGLGDKVSAAQLNTSIAGLVKDATLRGDDHLIVTRQDNTQTDLGYIRGATGPTGAQGTPGTNGAAGATGATGPANSLSIGTVTKLAAGATPTATVTGTAPSQTLNLGMPTGDIGPKGDTGDQIPFNSGGSWTGSVNLDGFPFPVELQRTLAGNVTLSLSNRVNGSVTGHIVMVFIQAAAGGYTITWPTTVKWSYGIKPIMPAGPGLKMEYTFRWDGLEWLGKVTGAEYA